MTLEEIENIKLEVIKIESLMRILIQIIRESDNLKFYDTESLTNTTYEEIKRLKNHISEKEKVYFN